MNNASRTIFLTVSFIVYICAFSEMDVVEEFLELGRQVSWSHETGSTDFTCKVNLGKRFYFDENATDHPQTISQKIVTVSCLHQFIDIHCKKKYQPRLLHLRTNLQDLFRSQKDCGRNGPRNFWNWMAKQSWRKMLPTPFECHGVYMFYRIISYQPQPSHNI